MALKSDEPISKTTESLDVNVNTLHNLVEVIYNRKIVGWEVHDSETGERVAELMQRTVMAEQCFRKPLVLHSDMAAPQ